MNWREVKFTYEVPKGLTNEQAEELEQEMIEASARIIGCECDETSTECFANWVGTSGPIRN